MLEKRRKKLEKKIIVMEAETNIVDKKAFKKRLKSMKYTLESLENQILDNQGELRKALKDRIKHDPKPEIVEKVEELNKRSALEELKRRLREQAERASEEREQVAASA